MMPRPLRLSRVLSSAGGTATRGTAAAVKADVERSSLRISLRSRNGSSSSSVADASARSIPCPGCEEPPARCERRVRIHRPCSASKTRPLSRAEDPAEASNRCVVLDCGCRFVRAVFFSGWALADGVATTAEGDDDSSSLATSVGRGSRAWLPGVRANCRRPYEPFRCSFRDEGRPCEREGEGGADEPRAERIEADAAAASLGRVGGETELSCKPDAPRGGGRGPLIRSIDRADGES